MKTRDGYDITTEHQAATEALEWLNLRHQREDEARKVALAQATDRIARADADLVTLMVHNDVSKLRSKDRTYLLVTPPDGRDPYVDVIEEQEPPNVFTLTMPPEPEDDVIPSPEFDGVRSLVAEAVAH